MRNLLTVFYSGYASLYSHQQYTKFLFSPSPHQQLLFVIFLTAHANHFDRCEVIFYCGFDFNFLDDWWHSASFHMLVGICMSSLEKCPFRISCHLKIVFWCWVVWIRYVFGALIAYCTYHLKICSPFQEAAF